MSNEFAPEDLFALLEGPALTRLTQMPVERGTQLIKAGSPAEAMYLVETGRFLVRRGSVDLAEIGTGGVLGEIAFFTGSQEKPRLTFQSPPASASSTCLPSPSVIVTPSAFFRRDSSAFSSAFTEATVARFEGAGLRRFVGLEAFFDLAA